MFSTVHKWEQTVNTASLLNRHRSSWSLCGTVNCYCLLQLLAGMMSFSIYPLVASYEEFVMIISKLIFACKACAVLHYTWTRSSQQCCDCERNYCRESNYARKKEENAKKLIKIVMMMKTTLINKHLLCIVFAIEWHNPLNR